MEYALIKDGVVVRCIVADAEFVDGIRDMWDRIEPVAAGVGIGWAWTAEGYSPPPPAPAEPELPAEAPHSCSRRQGRLALLMLGLLDTAEAAIAAMPEGSDKRGAQIEYEADTWERHNPFLSALWAQLGGTPDSLDEAFALAVSL
ncbi:hypothetical protein [Delftia sp. HK171]|uniref:hypothetical protein n=1 Tax=Delftia sp. HK171 TaxID=1920191 RepID=UPI000B02F568|nr:hypothetical protein [Delftia sp. HK171]